MPFIMEYPGFELSAIIVEVSDIPLAVGCENGLPACCSLSRTAVLSSVSRSHGLLYISGVVTVSLYYLLIFTRA